MTAVETNLISLKVNHTEHQNARSILVKEMLLMLCKKCQESTSSKSARIRAKSSMEAVRLDWLAHALVCEIEFC